MLGANSKKTSSRLVIAGVQRSDSGNYTCTTDSAQPSLIVVYVSDGRLCNHAAPIIYSFDAVGQRSIAMSIA